ncbi:MAG TPA: OmpA family protein [Telluria sp.]|nr:OmpA family protein [Telluria sp.]
MFDDIINALAQQFGLGDRARPFVQMLLARISDPGRGGVAGFLQRLRAGGIGSAVDGWTASPASHVPVAEADLERAIGDDTLVPDMAARFGLDRSKVVAALSYALPAIVAQVARGGAMPAALPADAESFIGTRSAWAGGAPATPRAVTADPPSRSWLPWVIGGVVVLLALGYCTTMKRADRTEPAPAPAEAPVAATPATPAAEVAPEVIPEGAAVVMATVDSAPALKVYFDTGKSDVHSEFATKAVSLVEYLKGNTIYTAVISGFNDPTGDPEANARLSKERAEAVQAALVAAGLPKDRTLLEKPADTTGTGATNAASRRVDVVIAER